MAGELLNIADQYKGLPMGELIGAPLGAACESQVRLAKATADFIHQVGFTSNADGSPGATRQVNFNFKRPTSGDNASEPGGTFFEEEVELSVPLLSIVKVPNLSITTVDIVFDMEVKSSFTSKESNDYSGGFEAEARVGFGPFSATVKVHGSVAAHKENTRSSDNSAKYHVEVHATDAGMPEGLARVMDILQTAAAPRRVSGPQAIPPVAAVANSARAPVPVAA
jgi:hypothetical protein